MACDGHGTVRREGRGIYACPGCLACGRPSDSEATEAEYRRQRQVTAENDLAALLYAVKWGGRRPWQEAPEKARDQYLAKAQAELRNLRLQIEAEVRGRLLSLPTQLAATRALATMYCSEGEASASMSGIPHLPDQVDAVLRAALTTATHEGAEK